MKDADCVAFLRWALPRMSLRWEGFRRVRRQVCRRISRRLSLLGLEDLAAYRDWLEAHPEEWGELDDCCRITISRFGRDRGVFAVLGGEVLPALARAATARGASRLHAWSAGCASGEEPYSLKILWELEPPSRRSVTRLHICATDADERLLERAVSARYPTSALRDLPASWRRAAFEVEGDLHRLRPEFREGVEFRRADIRQTMPEGPFDLVLCRNSVFTYFETGLQVKVLAGIVQRLRRGGALALGAHEALPEGAERLEPWSAKLAIYRYDG